MAGYHVEACGHCFHAPGKRCCVLPQKGDIPHPAKGDARHRVSHGASLGDVTAHTPPMQFLLYSAAWTQYTSSVHRLQNVRASICYLSQQPLTPWPQDGLGATRVQHVSVTDYWGRTRPSDAGACQGLRGAAGLLISLTFSFEDPWSLPWSRHPCMGSTDWWTILHRVPRYPWTPCAARYRRPRDTPGGAAACAPPSGSMSPPSC
jgi:hypothetical protein